MKYDLKTMITIDAINAFSDNYIWKINANKATDELSDVSQHACLVVDPGDADAVLGALTPEQIITDILITHHHYDHTDGIAKLKTYFPDANVYGPDTAKIPLVEHKLKQGDKLCLAHFGLEFEILALPGHTLDHIAYLHKDFIFCGDTLFSAGCGRMFEGTPEQYWPTLNKLKSLPEHIKVYCTHEYTLANLAFAQHIEPDNQAIIDYSKKCQQLRQENKPTLPSKIALEKQINPFLRANLPHIKQSAIKLSASPTSVHKLSDSNSFALLRQLKDNF